MNTYVTFIGLITLLAIIINAVVVIQLLSNAKDRAYALGYASGAETPQREITRLRIQLGDLQADLFRLRNTREQERRSAALALEQTTLEADQRVQAVETRTLTDEDALTLRRIAQQLDIAHAIFKAVNANVAAASAKTGAKYARGLADRIGIATAVVQERAA